MEMLVYVKALQLSANTGVSLEVALVLVLEDESPVPERSIKITHSLAA